MATIIRLPHIPTLTLEHCRLLVESVDEYAIFMLDAAGYVVTWNRGAERLKGYSADAIMGRHFSVFYTPEDLGSDKPAKELEIARAAGKVIDEGWRLRKDGSRFWANVTITALRDHDGSLVGYAKVTRDLTERRTREEQLRHSEERLRLMIESVSDYALYMLDRSGYVTMWNVGAQRIKGYSAEEVIGKHFSVFFPPDAVDAGQPERELAIAARDGRFEDDGWRIRKDGTRFWANALITAVHDERGNLLGFAKITRDLTAQRSAEQQLRRSEERLRLMVEAVSDYAVYMLDPGGFVNTWNQGAQRLKGYTAAEAIGQHFSRFFPTEAVRAGRPEAELETARQEGRFEEEGWRVRKDGTRFWAGVVITSIRGPEGELLGFAKVTRDLTERHRTEDELRRSEERLRLLVEAVSDYAIYMLDPEGRVTTWNVGAQRIKGYARDEIVGKSFAAFFPPEALRDGKPAEELAHAKAHGRFEEEGWRVRKDGSRFWANVVLTPIHDSHGDLVGFAKVTRELTERVRAENAARSLAAEKAAREASEANEARMRESAERAETAAKLAEEANRAKDAFLATVSHELRTPLNAILGWSSVLRARNLEATVAKAVEVIERNATAQAKIIDDILDVSRIVTGKLKLDLKPLNLLDLVRAELDVVRPAADAKRIALDLSAASRGISTLVDATRMQQVIWNLLSNAVKFTDEDGSIDVELQRTDGHAVISVRDTGRGIDPAFVPHVFEPFKQADSSTTRREGGLGLGLTIVRDLVQLHGGKVSAFSGGPGQGATFSVTIPIRNAEHTRADEADPEAPAPLEHPVSSLRGVRVLIVDDEPDTRELLRDILGQEGGDVAVAGSAAEAIDVLQRFRPHVLVSDVGMPHQDGYALMRCIRALSPAAGGSVPAIALTAYTQARDRAEAHGAGFTTHMAKPIDPSELVVAVANLAHIDRQ